jgi:hypothetical protein
MEASARLLAWRRDAMLKRRHTISLLRMLPGLWVARRAIAAAKVSRDQVERIISGIKMKPKWREISIDENDPASLTLRFKEPPTFSEARFDAESVAKEVVQGLVADGYDPKAESTNIYVHVQQDGLKTVTGRPAVRPFGTAYYSHTRDRIEWDAHRD